MLIFYPSVGAAGHAVLLNGKELPSSCYLSNRKFSSCLLPPDNVTLQYYFNHFRSSLKTKHCFDIQQETYLLGSC